MQLELKLNGEYIFNINGFHNANNLTIIHLMISALKANHKVTMYLKDKATQVDPALYNEESQPENITKFFLSLQSTAEKAGISLQYKRLAAEEYSNESGTQRAFEFSLASVAS